MNSRSQRQNCDIKNRNFPLYIFISWASVCHINMTDLAYVYDSWVSWSTFIIILCRFFVLLELDSPSPHSLQLYWKESPGYSSKYNFSWKKESHMVCNDVRVSKWWLNCHFCLNYPFKVCLCLWGKISPCSLTQGHRDGSFFSGGWICMTSSMNVYSPCVCAFMAVYVWAAFCC